jgi:Fe-S cluster assembly iron-binding protein IscA
MLVLTEKACSLIRSLNERYEFSEDAGLRIAGPSDGSSHLTVSVAEAPRPDDQVVEQEGARVFVEPAAATVLDDKVLDVRVDDGGGVQFLLAGQE